MEEDLLWSKFDSAVSSFSLKTTIDRIEPEIIVSSLIGDGKRFIITIDNNFI